MKISRLEIKDFHQFKDFSIDLTYPKGHVKEGQPLDKICFIGQSGTGKTTLLELIPYFLYNYETNLVKNIDLKQLLETTLYLVHGEKIKNDYDVKIIWQGGFVKSWNSNPHKPHPFSHDERMKIIKEWVLSESVINKLIYFPSSLNFDLDVENDGNINKDKIIDFSNQKVANVWNLILDKIQKYQEQELQIRQEIAKTVEQSSNNLETIQKALKKLEDWKIKEFNPIQDVADHCLDKLLANFKLKVKTELDIKTKDDIGFIKIEDYKKNEIPNGLWSTGTKQVILSALPLYLLKPKQTIILFDEPERSLYPDLQRTIVDYYTSLADDCQFFYATHSPIIASSFDPWEIVELKFNEEGKIYREVYYEGENHIDNYKWNPKLMRWDDILQRVFDLQDDGSPLRREKLNELATYNVKYRKLEKKGELDKPEAQEIIKNIEKLSKELSSWN
ncbi:MAG: AAA family ATPase [Saprospiraceae bacterium]|nr:AAA family ATPase [Saprospiraceae bacterium]MBP9196425.1 AAA family ATPase [Saprospiraceae bacterium]